MSANDICRKAQQLHTKARLAALSWMVIGLFLCVGFARIVARSHLGFPAAGCGLLSVWGLYAAYQAYRWIWPGELPRNAPMRTALEFYKNELLRQRDYVRELWNKAGLTFCFLGLAMIVIPEVASMNRRLLWNGIPFFVLLGAWFAMFFPSRRRRQRKLQEELDEVEAFEQETR